MWYVVRKNGKLTAVYLTLKESANEELDLVGYPFMEEYEAMEWIESHKKLGWIDKSKPEAPHPIPVTILDAALEWEVE